MSGENPVVAQAAGVIQVDAQGVIRSANVAALRILGRYKDDLRGRHFGDLVLEAPGVGGSVRARCASLLAEARRTGEPVPPMTLRVAQPGGETSVLCVAVPVPSADVDDASFVVTLVDVTVQTNAEVALRRSEELVRSVLESAPNPIATADRNGKLVFINKIPRGHTPQEILGNAAWAHLAPEDRPVAKACFERVIATGELGTYECSGESGARWRVWVGPRREGDQIVGATFVAWDVTRFKELESQLMLADRMAAIGTVAAAVAHEINNPLTYLLANLEWIARDAPSDAMRERTAAALEGARRIRNVVSDVQHFSYVAEGRRALLDVRELLDSACRMAEYEIRWRARLVKRYAVVPSVLASEGRLGQVFLNLLVNAAQAFPEGAAEGNEIVLYTGTDERGRVVVEISDNGMGITPGMDEKIFEPFVTTKPRGAGTGLGLYVCREVVQGLGGTITVGSRPGHSTTLRVVLPAATSVPGAEPPRPEAPAHRRSLRILVVDDEPLILDLLKSYLVGHEVRPARGAREGVALASADEFDLVLCDLAMPDGSGLDVYDAIRTQRPGREGRVVFMTGGIFTEKWRRSLDSIPNDVLEKPFTLDELSRVVARNVT